MRLIVFSDSHGRVSLMRKALEMHKEADIIVHLGDCERDTAYLEDLIGNRQFYRVCGNCDFMPEYPVNELIKIGNTGILCTHGHIEKVKYGTEMLEEKIRRMGFQVALYGHTHCPDSTFRDGVYLFNPGAAQDGKYGIVDVTENGIMCVNAQV